MQKTHTMTNNQLHGIPTKTVIPVNRPTFGSSQNDTSLIYGSSLMNEQTILPFATFGEDGHRETENVKQAISTMN